MTDPLADRTRTMPADTTPIPEHESRTDRHRAVLSDRAATSATSSFGARLRRERERRQISIASIAESTKILGALLEGMENDDVSRWPTGFYRRAFIRAYATAVGLDPEPVVREFLQRFPEPAEVAAPPTPTPAAGAAGAVSRAGLRLTLADHGTFTTGPVVRELKRRGSAVAFDAFVLSVAGLALFVTLGTLWAPLTLVAICYYFASILILGNTPGVCLFASKPTPAPARRAPSKSPPPAARATVEVEGPASSRMLS